CFPEAASGSNRCIGDLARGAGCVSVSGFVGTDSLGVCAARSSAAANLESQMCHSPSGHSVSLHGKPLQATLAVAGIELGLTYSMPMVDHGEARE
ncbi:MAG: hypothetical protein ACR2Q4_23390, partial [Geminicoccaceae bacterium]